MMRLGVCVRGVLALCVLGVLCQSAPAPRLRQTRQTQPRATAPWILNQDVCPPLLCPPVSAALTTQGTQSDVQAQPPASFEFFEGDIVLDSGQSRDMVSLGDPAPRVTSSRRRQRRSVVRPITKLWKYGEVPYVIDQSLGRQAQHAIELAIRHYEQHTCLRFISKGRQHKDFLSFVYQPGCWSSVGKTSGEQYLSVGPGCEDVGTVVHEMGHALGFWHEQSRLDRNKYVKIIKKNIPQRYLKQFGIRAKNESTTRGFPYDYHSIMHYGPDFFSGNGKDTIQVIGLGKKYKFKIGQRKGLSAQDIAQLNEMYHCNAKSRNRAVCPSGWVSHGKSCYGFVTKKKQFGAASEECRAEGGHLLHVNSAQEDAFIKKHLITHFSNHPRWRTGGKKSGSSWVWYDREAARQVELGYTAWSPGQPSRFSSLVLARFDGTPPRFVWKGDWLGSASQLPKFAFPFICETEQDGSCIKSRDGKGRDYRGQLSYTAQGITCQHWSTRYPHKHGLLTGDPQRDARNGLGDHNYCRNPNGMRDRPWCYTTKSKVTWRYCELKIC